MTAVANHRDSSLELYRIIVMLAIVACHYVDSSGLIWKISAGGGMTFGKFFLLCFGVWGKVGINCFVLITGYFMCESTISLKKFLKLLLQVLFYSYVIGLVFFLTGYEPLKANSVLDVLFPFRKIACDFTSCFLVFYLCIPFLNVLVRNVTRRQHELLLLLTVGVFSFLPTIPVFSVQFNYVQWFAVLFFVSSYLRKYPMHWTENRRLWIGMSLFSIVSSLVGIYASDAISHIAPKIHLWAWHFMADSNKITALAASVCFFLAFKPSQKIEAKTTVDLGLQPRPAFYSPLINTIASATFGVLLIHANSNAMRRWLWGDVCGVVGWYNAHSDSALLIIGHAFGCVVAIFTICAIIDLLRQRFIEKPLFAKLFPASLAATERCQNDS